MAAEQILFEFEVKGGDAALQEAAKLNTAIRGNKEQIKELSKEYDKNAVEIQQLQNENKKLSAEQRTLAKSANSVKGSYNALSAEMSELKRRQKEVNVTTQQGQKQYQEYGKRINDINNRLKQLDATNGVHTRNVGNYSGAIKNAAGQLNIMGVNVGMVSNQFTTATTAVRASTMAIGGTSKALRVLKIAIAATGIGALVLAVTALVSWFSKTREGGESIRVAFAQIGQVVNVLIERLTIAGKGIFNIVSGNFRQGIEDLTGAFKGMGDELEREVKLIAELERRAIKLEKAEILLNATRAQTRREIKALQLIAEDETISAENRIVALEKAIQKQQELSRLEQRIQTQKIKNILGEVEGREKLDFVLNQLSEGFSTVEEASNKANAIIDQIGLDPSTVDDLKELVDEVIRLNDVESAALKQERTLQTRLNSLYREANKERETEKKSGVAGVIRRRTVNIKEELAATEETTMATANLATVTVEGYTMMTEESDRYIENQIRLAKVQQALFNEVQQGFGAAMDIANQYYSLNDAMMQRELAKAGENADKRAEIERKYAKRRQKIDIAMAIIKGAQSILQLWANESILPSPANEIYKGVMSALIAGTTAAQVSTIKNQQFADGGLNIDYSKGGIGRGPLHSQGGIQMFTKGGRHTGEFEGNEAVINRKSTAMYKPLLSAINVAGGGKAFESGGINSVPSLNNMVNSAFADDQMMRLEKAFMMQKTVLPIPTATATQRDIQVVESNSTL